MVFCVECGRDVVSEEELRDGLCVDCLLERNPAVRLPRFLDLVRCPTCGAVRTRGGWTDARGEGEDEDVQRAAARAAEEALVVLEGARVMSLDLHTVPEARSVFAVDVVAEVEVMDRVVRADAGTRVRVRGETCPVCSRRAGQYYEAIVQFRGTRERPPTSAELDRTRAFVEEEVARLSEMSRGVFVVKEERIHGGLDFYLSDQTAATQLARGLCSLLSASCTTSTSTVGRRDGRDVVRVTHAVRLPELRRGDYVMLRGELMRVVSATAKEATVDVAAGEGRRRHVTRGDRADLELVAEAGSVQEAVVVSSSGAEVQVLDPDTLLTVDLRLPEGYSVEGRETLRVVRREDQLFIVD